MASFKGACILFIFGLSIALTSGANIIRDSSQGAWVPVDWRTLPKANADDKVQVIYLVAPLLEESYGNLFGMFDLFHGAIAFRNLNQNSSITINYDAMNFFHSSLFPFVHDNNGTRWLEWQNGGANFIYYGINETYWTKTNEVVGLTTGDVYNRFISTWNAQINATEPYYDMLSILDHFNGTLFVDGYDCFDFAVEALQVLAGYGADFSQGTIGKDEVNIYSSIVPENVTDLYNTNPAVRETIIDFFEIIQASAKDMSIIEIALTIFETFEGNWYVRENTEYWRVKITWPFFGLDYVQSALPSSPSLVQKNKPLFVRSPLVKLQ